LTKEALIVEEIFSEAAWRRAESEIIDEADWYQVTTPEAPTIALNGIYRCKLDDEVFEKRLSATKDEYKKLNLPFRWIVGPSSRPRNLELRLKENGFQLNSESSGMVALVNEIKAQIAPGISVEIIDEMTVDDYVETCSAGWAMPDHLKAGLRSDLLSSIQSRDQTLVYCVAKYEGKPAGSATLKLTSQSAHLLGGSVHPDFRMRGIYQALVAFRCDLAAKHGKSLITTHALKTTSAPLCAKMGLREVATFKMFSLEA
jgi:hypothetical protein